MEVTILRRFFRFTASLMAVLIIGLMGLTSYYSYTLPDNYLVFKDKMPENDSIGIKAVAASSDTAVGKSSSNENLVDLKLFGMIPIKQVKVTELKEEMVIPCGIPFGVKILTDGVMVIGMNDVVTNEGNINPAKKAGLQVGDVVVSINDENMTTNKQVGDIINSSDGKELKIKYRRGDKEQITTLTPVKKAKNGEFMAGLWVRDSSAGIGTLTFCTGDGAFGGLGHPICDVDTGDILPLASGEIVPATITGANKGTSGKPGELIGTFKNESAIGEVNSNTISGLYGKLNSPICDMNPVPLGLKQEAKTGKASIYTTVSGEKPQEYEIEIDSIDYNDETRNYVIKVTDERLLNATGGIVQGMSGSPIIQNGKLIGAVTHVFVNNPAKGYGIFAETMLEKCRK